jgi:hypothetical protein
MTKNEVLREFLALFGDVSGKGIPFDSWDAVFTVIVFLLKKKRIFPAISKLMICLRVT